MKTIRNILLSISLIIYTISVNAQCVQCDNNSNAQGTYSSAIGMSTTTTANSDGAFAGGYGSIADGAFAFAFGNQVSAHGTNSLAIGRFLETSTTPAMVLGIGYDLSHKLVDSISNSLMIGFNSDRPTFFVSGATGLGYTGRIGIGDVTDPQAKLHIKADSDEDADFLLEPGSSTKYARIKFGTNGNKIDARGSQDLNFHTASDFVFWDGNVGIGSYNPEAKLQISGGDIFIEDIDRGIIMKSPDGQCWRGTLDNSGSLNFTEIDCGSLTSVNSNDNDLKEVNIYPNPAKNSITIKIDGSNEKLNVNIYNQSGSLVISREMNSNILKIKTGKLPAGNYIVTIVDKTGKAVKSSKIAILK